MITFFEFFGNCENKKFFLMVFYEFIFLKLIKIVGGLVLAFFKGTKKTHKIAKKRDDFIT